MTPQVPALEIFCRCIIIYSFVLFVLRLSGKRQIGQMTPFDLVLLLLISNAVQNAMTGPDTTVVGGMIAAATLVVMNLFTSKTVLRSKLFRRWLQGNPTILINHGHLITAHLQQENISQDELLQALREHGVARVEDVRLAVLEVDGSISVVKQEDLVLEHASRPHHRIRFIRHSG